MNRERRSRLSFDQSKLVIDSEVKLVSGFGGPPSSGCVQIFETSPSVLINEIPLPSGVQPIRAPTGILRYLTAEPPSIEKIANLAFVLSFTFTQHATNFPSGDMSGWKADPSMNRMGEPPSTGTFHTWRSISGPAIFPDVKKAHFPSGVREGCHAPPPLVNRT